MYKFTALLGALALIVVTTSLALADADAEARFEQIERALAGDARAIDGLASSNDERAFLHFVRGAALARLGNIDDAAAAYQKAIRSGDDLAILALAEMLADAERFLDAYAWAQVWVQNRFELADIHGGKANRDPGMAILRQALEQLDDAAIEQAERHAGQVLSDWLPKFEHQPTSCIQPVSLCDSWSLNHRRRPVFPHQMGMRGEEGWTRHALLIDADGRVAQVATVHSTHDAARRNAERALRRWQFESNAEEPTSAIFQQTVLFGRW